MQPNERLHYQKYYIDYAQITESMPISSECAGIMFYNPPQTLPIVGADVLINNFRLIPGNGMNVDCNVDELDVTQYFVRFDGPGVKRCEVFRKIYVDKSR